MEPVNSTPPNVVVRLIITLLLSRDGAKLIALFAYRGHKKFVKLSFDDCYQFRKKKIKHGIVINISIIEPKRIVCHLSHGSSFYRVQDIIYFNKFKTF